jgi:tetratricopeptide (TPR) repeat protein
MNQPQRRNVTSDEAAVSAWLSNPALLAALIALLSFLVYLPALGFGFVSDDQMQVLSNPLVLSWRMIPRALQSNLWFQVVPTGTYYRPFFVIWSILNHALFGFDPRGWHFSNIVLHVIAASLVFALLRKVRADYWTAALAAVFFAIHPVHIESVAWVSAGSDLLVAVLFVAAFLAYLNFREPGGRRRVAWLCLSFLSCACALLTKEMAITLPVIIFLYEWLFPRDAAASHVRAKLQAAVWAAAPFGLLDAAYLVQRRRVLHGLVQMGLNDRVGALTTLKTIPLVLLSYLRLLVWPVGLNSFYYTAPVTDILGARFLVPLLGLLVLAGLTWYWFRRERDPLIPFFALWLVVCLVPVLYLRTFKIGDFVRDRYLYLPSIGFVFLLARALLGVGRQWVYARMPLLRPALLLALSLAFVAGTLSQQIYWANELLLYYRGYSLSPKSTAAAKFLAATLNRMGKPERAAPLLEQAIGDDPKDDYAPFTLAIVYYRLGRTAEAGQQLARAVALNPAYYSETSDGLTDMGIGFSTLQQYADAESSLKKALQLEPDAVLAHFYLGLVFLRTQRPAEGEQQLRQAIAINPTTADFHWALGLSRQMQGDLPGASREYEEELQLHPDNTQAQTSEREITLKRAEDP